MGEPRQEAESRAWTVDEMRKGSGSWSLASDAGMLQHLQEYSQKMISRTHEIQTQVTTLLNEAKLTSVRVNNTFNDFIMLANTQFVENRVYDEDVTQESSEEEVPTKKEKTKEEREAELVPKVATAMRLGLGVIDSAFEKLDMNEVNSDSEDEEAGYKGEPLLEAKDPYMSRPLPYMIGSPSFLQDDDVGLIDFPSEDEDEAIPEEESESETESESEGESPAPTSHQQRKDQSDSDEYSEGSDLFHGEDSEDDLVSDIRPSVKTQGDSEDEVTTDAPRDFASELAAKITAAPVAPPESNKQGSLKKKKDKTKKQESKPPDDGDLFGPPSRSVDITEEDEDSPFGRGGGLFSSSKGGGGLFDEEDDLFSEVTAPPKKEKPPAPKVKEESSSSEDEPEAPPTKPLSKPKQKPTGGVSMFGGEDPDDLFAMPTGQTAPPKLPTSQQTKKAPPPSQPAASAVGGLFDNSEDEEEDFFAVVSKSSKVKDSLPSKPAKESLSKGLFDEDEGDLFADDSPPKPTVAPVKPQNVKPEKKLPAGAVSMFGSSKNPLMDALKSKQKPEPASSEDDQMGWSDDDKKSSQSAASRSSQSFKSANQVPNNKSANQITATKPRSGSTSSNSLFADDGDDLFDSSVSKASKKSAPVGAVASNGPSRMFDEEEEEEEEDLFKVSTKQKASVEKSIKQSGLFDDTEEEEVDIFATEPPPLTQQPSKKKPVGGVSLFGGADLFGDSLPKKTSEVHTKPQTPTVQKKAEPVAKKTDSVTMPTNNGAGPKKSSPLSLFDVGNDDDDEEEDDIFATATKTSTKKPVDPLFGDVADDLPESAASVDRKPQVDVKPKPKEKPVSKPPTEPQTGDKVGVSVKPSVGADLFDEDSDEDLFGDSTPSKQVQPVKPKPTAKPAVKPAVKAPPEPQMVQKVAGVTTKSSTTDMFNDSEEEDLFGDSTKPSTVITEPVKPKKPAGAVSMFGGMDPSVLLTKKTTPSAVKQHDSDIPETVITADPLGSVTNDVVHPSVQPRGPGPVIGSKVKGLGVQGLQSRLAINPSSLLPGATPPVQEVPEVRVGFDDPPQSQTLHTVAKDRVKLRTGRRPPTRQARKSRADLSGPEFSNTANISSSQNAAVANKTDVSNSRVAFPSLDTGPRSGPFVNKDEPSDIDDFMGSNRQAENSIGTKSQDKGTASKSTGLFSSDIDDEGDIFSTSTGKTTTDNKVPEYTHSNDVSGIVAQNTTHSDDVTAIVAQNTTHSDVTDIAAQETAQTDDVSTTEKVQSWLEHSEPITKPSSKSVFEEGDEDIFNSNASKSLSHDDHSIKPSIQGSQSVRSDRSATVSSHHSTLSSKSLDQSKVVNKEEHVRDSLNFNRPLLKTDIPDSSTKASAQSKAVIEDDIFADSKLRKKTKTIVSDEDDLLFTSSKLSSKPKVPLLANDDADDLFSSSKLSIPSKPVSKVGDDIFSTNVPTKKKAEDHDIFANIMKPSKPLTAADLGVLGHTNGPFDGTKAKTKPTVRPAEVDDIFADISSQPVQQQKPTDATDTTAKSAKKTKKSKKAVVKDEDIFKDDTDIFADIPAVKPKQPKTKKCKPQNKPLFGAETDDIFADTSSSVKPKKTKKSQKSSVAATSAFDKDAPNIFDDPLSALNS